MTKNHNDITGDKLITKPSTKAFEDGYELAFGAKQSNGQGWQKHDETPTCPTALDDWIEVETYTSTGSFIELAANLEWKYVKFYRVIPAKK